jgi:hypothetical protein
MGRIFLLVIGFVTVLTVPALARQWTSREGGFSVEAELVDVKGGNVILKKADGTQISIPLGKLSLGDIRFVKEVLRDAEAGVTGGTAETPVGVKGEPQPEASPAVAKPAVVDPATLKKLRYGWKKDETYVYHVRVIGERGNETENRSGKVTYRVKSTRSGEVQLAMTSDLKYAEAQHSRRYVLLPGRHIGFVTNVDKPREATIRIDSCGRLLESKGEAPLPYLLGDLSELIVEPLSRVEGPSWTITSDPALAVVSIHYPYWRSSQAAFREGVPAVEKTVYNVVGESDSLIVISKHYEMNSAATLSGKPRIEASGDGRLKFDTQRGVFSSLDFDMRVTVRDSNKTEDTPLHISYRLLSEQELAEEAKEAQKVKDDAEKALREKVRPLTDKEIETALVDLASGDNERVAASAALLAVKKPEQPNPKIARALEAVMLQSENVSHRTEAARALKFWSTPESVVNLMKALNDSWPPVRSNAMEALCKYSPKEAIKPAAQQLLDLQTRGAAEKFLRAIGPEAEDAVLAHVTSPDPWVRACVCGMLESLGTKKSLPALEKALTDENWMVNGAARKSLAAVKAREGAGAAK